jgi:hypothetical protein
MDIKSSKLCLCRIGSDAAKDELEGQRSCRGGQSALRLAQTDATRLTAGAVGRFDEIIAWSARRRTIRPVAGFAAAAVAPSVDAPE